MAAEIDRAKMKQIPDKNLVRSFLMKRTDCKNIYATYLTSSLILWPRINNSQMWENEKERI